MSDNENETESSASASDREVFSAAFFAALQGVASRAHGQDPGAVVNEAHTLAERAVERLTSGKPVLTNAQRDAVANEPAADASGKPVVSGNAMQVGGRFARPAASTP